MVFLVYSHSMTLLARTEEGSSAESCEWRVDTRKSRSFVQQGGAVQAYSRGYFAGWIYRSI
jgi:hypothetical protein